jgi:hypothetical protein
MVGTSPIKRPALSSFSYYSGPVVSQRMCWPLHHPDVESVVAKREVGHFIDGTVVAGRSVGVGVAVRFCERRWERDRRLFSCASSPRQLPLDAALSGKLHKTLFWKIELGQVRLRESL